MIDNFFNVVGKNKMEFETEYVDPDYEKKPWIEKY